MIILFIKKITNIAFIEVFDLMNVKNFDLQKIDSMKTNSTQSKI